MYWHISLTNIVILKVHLSIISSDIQDLAQVYLEGTHRLVNFHFGRKRVPDDPENAKRLYADVSGR